MNEEGLDPTQGLPEDLFLFATILTPCANIDLFVVNEEHQVLLTWRDGLFHGKGWHILGGCIRIKGSLDTRAQNTAINELGCEVVYVKIQ